MAYIIKIGPLTKKADNNLNDVVYIQDIVPSKKEYDLFDIEEVADNASELIHEMESAMPERKMVWLDKDEYKEITKAPKYNAKYINGRFEHTYGDKTENSTPIATKLTKVRVQTDGR